MRRARHDREAGAVDAREILAMIVLIAVRPGLFHREQRALGSVSGFLRRVALHTLIGFGAAVAGARARPKMEALERFEAKHGRPATNEELDELFRSG